MSADLFAEFSQPASNSSHQHQHQHQQQPSKPQSPFTIQNNTQNKPPPIDPFASFSIPNNTAPYSPPTSSIQWPSAQPQQQQQSTFASTWASPPASFSASQTAQQVSPPEEDDGWGDFEVAETEASNPPSHVVNASSAGGWASSSPSLPQQVTHDPYSQSSSTFAPQTSLRANFNVPETAPDPFAQRAPERTVSKPKQLVSSKAADPNVLFDAEDFELDGADEEDGFDDDDDFGDFETVQTTLSQQPNPQLPPQHQPPAKTSYNMPSMDLLSLDEPEPTISKPVVETMPNKQGSGLKFGALSRDGPSSPTKPVSQAAATPRETAKKPTTKVQASQTAKPKPQTKSTSASFDAWGGEDFDESWSAWDDGPTTNTQTTAKSSREEPDSWDWNPSTADAASMVDDNSPPPVNVPPPSIILSTFPELFKLGETIFKSTTGQNAATKQQILSNPKTVEFLTGYILLANTAGRVIAGRKQRWHRDKILAKSMSISAAGSKGMKLAGVDKTQSVREDREAADVVAAWKEHVGRLRSAVAVANSSAQANLKVPELSETMLVQTAKVVPTAPKPCVICGLKRDERVNKLDFEVEDSFGEWWVEHWGHRACKNFWVEHEKQLRQR